jgi:hypothetical protein
MHGHDGARWAPLETLICAGCGYTAWYSGAAASLPMQRVYDESLRCLDCGGDELHIEQLSDGSTGVRAPFGMALMVCACGRCEWVRGVGGQGDAPDVTERDSRPCPRCLDDRCQKLYPVYEDGLRALPVARVGKTAVGAFELRWCTTCSLCEWFAREIDMLRPDGRHIIYMEGETRTAGPVAGGPYR